MATADPTLAELKAQLERAEQDLWHSKELLCNAMNSPLWGCSPEWQTLRRNAVSISHVEVGRLTALIEKKEQAQALKGLTPAQRNFLKRIYRELGVKGLLPSEEGVIAYNSANPAARTGLFKVNGRLVEALEGKRLITVYREHVILPRGRVGKFPGAAALTHAGLAIAHHLEVTP